MLVIRNYNPDKINRFQYGPNDTYYEDLHDSISLSEIEIYYGSSKLTSLSGYMSTEHVGDSRSFKWSNCFDGIDGQEASNGLCHTYASYQTGQPSMLYVNLDNRKFDRVKVYNRLVSPLRIIGAEIYVLQGVTEATRKVWTDTFRLNSNKAEAIHIFSFDLSLTSAPSYVISWTQTSAPSGYWFSVASDSTGQYLVAGQSSPNDSGGYIYRSSDGGKTWNACESPYNTYARWIGMVSSSNGQRLAAVQSYGGAFLVTSSDGKLRLLLLLLLLLLLTLLLKGVVIGHNNICLREYKQ